MASESPVLVRMRGVTAGYGAEPVVAEIDLQVASGEFVGVVGPSGSGKTTLLRVLLGSVAPVAGSVDRGPDLRISYVPQVGAIDWSFPVTVQECVLMARHRWLPWPSRDEVRELTALLDRLGIADLARRHIRELSGGQQQRVFLARALLRRPHLLLLDEPTSGVDVRTRHEVLHLLRDLNRDGLAILLTTHDLNGIAAHLPRLVCLNRTVIGSGTPAEVLTADVLERTYGAKLEVLEHGGMPVIVESHEQPAL